MSNQTQATSQDQQQAQQEPRAPFYLSGQMLDVIMNSLSQLPYAQSAPVIEDLRAQYMELERRGKEEMEARQAAGDTEAEHLTGEAEGTAE